MKKNLYHVIFNLFALSILIYIGVDIFYRTICFRLTEISSVEMAEVRTPNIAHYVPQPLNSFDVIVDRNIFGSSEEASRDVETQDMEAKEIEALEPTSLKISLLGTVTGSEENACAVIEETGRKTQGLYRVGDAVQNAVVKKILWGKVVLRVGDKDEILSMEAPESVKGGRPDHSIKPVQSGDTITVARSDIQDSFKNINKLLTQARIRPHLKDGKPDGFVLSYIKANSFFTKLGLKRGDIIKSINGKQINTPEDAFSFYQALESGAPLSMEISRGGKPKTINYRFK
ncbi:MAG: PDZ domain-containing protein [Desulfobacteraceae bacterium]|nr:PDZ domain-containing protein [Desulfobacteraceae bacterium]